MLNNLVLGRYQSGNSKIHYMHPLSKIICTTLFVIMVLICNNIKLMILLSGLSILLIEMANISRSIYLKTTNSLKFILLFILIINLIYEIVN